MSVVAGVWILRLDACGFLRGDVASLRLMIEIGAPVDGRKGGYRERGDGRVGRACILCSSVVDVVGLPVRRAQQLLRLR